MVTRSLHPPCAGSAFYGPHSAKIPHGYTVISPGGKVWCCCDSDCLRKVLDAWTAEAAETTSGALADLRRIGQQRDSR